jgi:hypothetical protein
MRWALTLSRVLWLWTVSRSRWVPALPCVLWLWISPLGWGELRCWHVSCDSDATMCLMAPDLTSQRGGLQRCHMYYGSRPLLLAEVGSGAITCPAGPYGPWASSIKKSVTGLPVQPATHVSNARAHVSKVPHIRAIMRLQDVQTRSVVNTYKAYGHVATVRRQHYGSLVWHHYNAKWLDSTTPHC